MTDPTIPDLAGRSEAFRDFCQRLRQAAGSTATVLLSGESGTGKGLAARWLHAWSARAEGPLVVTSLAALSPTLVEAELFGHEEGAFTGAHRARAGRFRQADGGTLVLEDVDALPADVQGRLLRALQEREVVPLGGERPVPVDVRVAATSAADLGAAAREGRFREDLYYRLAVVPLRVPALRERSGDVPLLAGTLLARAAARLGVPERPLGSEALARLEAHPWPGNVRELENAMERVVVLGAQRAPEPIAAGELDFLDESTRGALGEVARLALASGRPLAEIEAAVLAEALEETRGNVSAAARRVGLTRRAFEYRLARGRPKD